MRVHAHGALAGIELGHGGINGPNLYTREVPLAPSHHADPHLHAIRCRRAPWTRRTSATSAAGTATAALRAKRAGFDIVYVYAGHGFGVVHAFPVARATISAPTNMAAAWRTASRLLRELIEDTKDAVGDTLRASRCGFAVDELLGDDGLHATRRCARSSRMLAELPDLWDVAHRRLGQRFRHLALRRRAARKPYIAGVKQLTTKPVVGVGRFTSPDTMVRRSARASST